MLLDAADADRGRFQRSFDVCVVGSGPAGMTLARRLAARGLDVALMEAGGRDVSDESQDAYVGEAVGVRYFDLDVIRLRVLGGTSTHWSGWCRALDAHDFEPLPHRPYGWPIAKADLDPYQAAASEVLGLATPLQGPDLPVTQAEDRLRAIRLRQSEVRFGEAYLDEIAGNPRITACLNANLVDLTLGPDLATVTAARFRSYDPGDPGFEVRARAYALCLGGIENPRMLLNFTRQKPNGIGNDHDLVGRYFCEHPSYKVADLLFAGPPEFPADHFAPTLDFMLREQVLNFTLRLFVHAPPPASRPAALKAAAMCATDFTERLAEMLGRRPGCRWGGLGEYGIRRHPDRNPTGAVTLYTEQLLDRDSRVMLADATDAFGLRRIRLDWRLAEIDYRTMQAALMALGAHLAEQDIGRMRVRDWALADDPVLPEEIGREWEGSYHHMCTTRMADDPREGVVDADCRVHGTANLYLGGSSVFAAPGFATPTYTIVQLALRLGDHLADALTDVGALSGQAVD